MLDWRSAASAGAMAGIYLRLLGHLAATPGVVLERRRSLPGKEKIMVAVRALAGPYPAPARQRDPGRSARARPAPSPGERLMTRDGDTRARNPGQRPGHRRRPGRDQRRDPAARGRAAVTLLSRGPGSAARRARSPAATWSSTTASTCSCALHLLPGPAGPARRGRVRGAPGPVRRHRADPARQARLRRSSLPAPAAHDRALARYGLLSPAERLKVGRAALALAVRRPGRPSAGWPATR